jgi:protease-4
MRKHPVWLGIGTLLLIGSVFFVVIYALGLLTGGHPSFTMTGKVGVVRIDGVIAGIEEITDQLDEFADDDSIKAVVVRIDSPGGGVAPSQEIYQAVRQLRNKKKVVASMGSVAASGGYLIATAAERIVANPGTITGSISAVMHFADVQELMQKVGVRSSVVKSGKFKDIGTPVRAMTDEERQLVQGIVDDIYDQFVATVSENRRIPRATIARLADGRIFSGRQALKLKLVDALGGLQDAITLAGTLAGIEGKPATVYAIQKKTNFWKYLLENTTSAISGEIRRQTGGGGGVQYLLR